MILTNDRERTRFLRFVVVGTIGAVIDFGAFNLLSFGLGVPVIIAQAISFTLAVISNFVWNRYWTYPDSRSKHIRAQLIQFFAVNTIGVGIRTPLFAYLYTPLPKLFTWLPSSFPLSAEFIGHNLALAVAVGAVLFWNFFVNRYWTYSDVD